MRPIRRILPVFLVLLGFAQLFQLNIGAQEDEDQVEFSFKNRFDQRRGTLWSPNVEVGFDSQTAGPSTNDNDRPHPESIGSPCWTCIRCISQEEADRFQLFQGCYEYSCCEEFENPIPKPNDDAGEQCHGFPPRKHPEFSDQ